MSDQSVPTLAGPSSQQERIIILDSLRGSRLQIYQLYYVVAAVWIIEIVWSHLWLRQFRFGPLEWLWRSLTYWRRQPMKKEKTVQAISEPVLV